MLNNPGIDFINIYDEKNSMEHLRGVKFDWSRKLIDTMMSSKYKVVVSKN